LGLGEGAGFVLKFQLHASDARTKLTSKPRERVELVGGPERKYTPRNSAGISRFRWTMITESTGREG
jgi:hypothetical protein